jgi:hypothetical protein
MTNTRRGLLISLAVISIVLIVRGQDQYVGEKLIIFEDGQELHEKCRHQGEDSFPAGSSVQENLKIQGNDGYCIGYIIGAAEGMDLKFWSPPVPLKQEQVVAIARKYIDAHPEKWDQPASMLIRNALIEAFPPNKQ